MPAQGVDRLRPLSDQKLAHTGNHSSSLILADPPWHTDIVGGRSNQRFDRHPLHEFLASERDDVVRIWPYACPVT